MQSGGLCEDALESLECLREEDGIKSTGDGQRDQIFYGIKLI